MLATPEDKAAWEFKPQEGPQTLLLECPIAEIMFGGARGGGKTFGALLLAINQAETYGDAASILILRRSYGELSDVIKKSKRILYKLGWKFNKTDLLWTSPDGATIKLSYLENEKDAERIQGHEYTMVIVEEAGNFPEPEPIMRLWGAMRSAAGIPVQLILTCNPGGIGHDWLKARYVDAGEPLTIIADEDGNERIFIPSNITDNPELLDNDPGYVKRLKLSGNSRLVKAWVLGEWDIPDTGNIFPRSYWKYYKILPDGPMRIWMSVDTAFKKTKDSDYSAFVVGATIGQRIYILDVFVKKMEFPELKATTKRMFAKWRPRIIYVEDKSSGQSLVQEMKRPENPNEENLHFMMPIVGVEPPGDKITRASAASPIVEEGNVFLLEGAEWVSKFVTELEQFPKAKHDDQVDAFSQGILKELDIIRSQAKRQKTLPPLEEARLINQIFVR